MPSTITFRYNDLTYHVMLEPQTDGSYRAIISDDSGGQRTYTVQAQPTSSGWWLSLDTAEQRSLIHMAARNDKRYIYIDGEHFTLEVIADTDTRIRQRGRSSAFGGDLTAQMPGLVREVLVYEGDSVERGQTLLILEAMKMEIRVSAPNDGVVKRLLVVAGDVVERGQRLAEIS
jgi:biotin carboxyl carrier protein